jgi:hypothetical protein
MHGSDAARDSAFPTRFSESPHNRCKGDEFPKWLTQNSFLATYQVD